LCYFRYEGTKNVVRLRSVLGLAGVFRRLVRNFADKVMPLTDLLKAKNRRAESFELTKLEKESFLEIKNTLISPPVLALPKRGAALILETDASETQIGCVLLQDDGTKYGQNH
jgi:RNase H-like domain found in reverse transcriptase